MSVIPEPSIGLLVIATRHAQRHVISARARRFGLTTPQFWCLVALHQVSGLTPGELGGWMRLDAPATSRLVADLAGRKLLEPRPDRDDRRRTRLYLSPKGEPLAAQLQTIAAAYQEALVAGLTPEEIAALRSGLKRLLENLERFDARELDPAPPGGDRR